MPESSKSGSAGSVRVGLIGCGRIAQLVHLDALGRVPGLELVAAAEPVAERRDEVARRLPGCQMLEDHHQLLALPEVEAVLISLPNSLHAEVAVSALEAKKHVYLEKPLATNTEDGRRVVEAWRQSPCVGMIGFNYRFHPLHQELQRELARSRLGTPTLIRTAFTSPPRELPTWKRERASGGGVLLDYASHHIDLLRFLTWSEVVAVAAQIQSQRTEDDTASLQLELANGTLVQSYFSTVGVEKDRFEVQGTGGTLRLDRLGSKKLTFESASRKPGRLMRALSVVSSLGELRGRIPAALSSGMEPSFDACLARFATSIRGGASPTPDLMDGLCSLQVVEAAEESARTQQFVRLLNPMHS